MDYYFDNITGVLTAEKLHIHRFEFNDVKAPFDHEDLYITRYLQRINTVSLYITPFTIEHDDNDNLFRITISIVSGVSVFIGLSFHILRKKRKSRINEPIS